MSSFFAMNGYGFYVWSAYGLAALALAIEHFGLRSRRMAALEEARLTDPDTPPVPGAAE